MIVSGIERLSSSHKALSAFCSLGFIRKLMALVLVSMSPRLLGRPPLPVSGAMPATGTAAGSESSMGLGAKAESVSVNDGFRSVGVLAALRANGSGGVGRSAMAYVLSSASAALMSSIAWRRISAAYARGFSAFATPCSATSSSVRP